MLTKTQRFFTVFFLILLVIELVCGSIERLSVFRFFTKPLLLISLLIFFLVETKTVHGRLKIITVFALLFSLLGDVLLLFVDNSPNYFIAGLVSFLFAHVSYILIFKSTRNINRVVIPFALLLVLYGSVLFYFLYEGLKDMLIPVLVYTIVILTMALMAFYRKGKVSRLSYNFVFSGALIFLISDSLIAIDKFYIPLPYEHLGIMFTYGVAQLLIVFGILEQIKSNKAVTT